MDNIKKFVSDGCSMFPNYRWEKCCILHDKRYWSGGTKADRKQADKELYECVRKKGYPLIATIMYLGVRVGGHPYLPFNWRWGYGYKYPFRYE